jgi:hypothetical protein
LNHAWRSDPPHQARVQKESEFFKSLLECLPKVISEMVGDDLPVVAAKQQLCPTISEMTFGKAI